MQGKTPRSICIWGRWGPIWGRGPLPEAEFTWKKATEGLVKENAGKDVEVEYAFEAAEGLCEDAEVQCQRLNNLNKTAEGLYEDTEVQKHVKCRERRRGRICILKTAWMR